MERKRKRQRRINWTVEEENVLLELWEDKIPQLRDGKKTFQVYTKMAKELGYKYAPIEVKNKIHNLTNKYRDETRKIRASGASTSSWIHYDQVHQIIRCYKTFNFDEIAQESSTFNNTMKKELEFVNLSPSPPHTEDSSGIDESSLLEPGRKGKKFTSFQQEMLTVLRDINKKITENINELKEEEKEALKIQKEMVDIEKERNEILQQFLEEYRKK